MAAHILRARESAFIDAGNGVKVRLIASSATGSTSILSGITEIKAGGRAPEHFHDCEELSLVLEGGAVFHVDGARHGLKQGEAIIIPADVFHWFENASPTEPLTLLWTYPSLEATRTTVADGRCVAMDSL